MEHGTKQFSKDGTQMSEGKKKVFNIVSHQVNENCNYFEVSFYPNQNGQDN